MTNNLELSEREKKLRTRLIILAFVLFSIFILGMVYLATNPATTGSLLRGFTAGGTPFSQRPEV